MNLITELGVLTALVISVATALYFTHCAERRQEVEPELLIVVLLLYICVSSIIQKRLLVSEQ